ncbi:DUF4262 domain-containing protein [Spirillospora sp. CA-142024]|uniref:DUF4262 domain-containing protein n=1 Tax=Spirillospora sp. CA-142024 TaxID=3240036 RepID=UPI003D8B46E5
MTEFDRTSCRCLIHQGKRTDEDVGRVADRIRSLRWTFVDHGDHDLLDWCYEGPAWSCTVGLGHNFGFPELLICGLPRGERRYILKQAVPPLDHDLLGVGTVDHELTSLKLKVVRVHASWHGTELLSTACAFYEGRLPEYRQLIWADADGRFPGDDGFDEALKELQPNLDIPRRRHPKCVWTTLS